MLDERNHLDPAQQAGATGDMDPEAFRRYGYEIVDWISSYLTNVRDYPVLAQSAPGTIRRSLPAQPPQTPEPMEAILGDFERIIMPGITHWNSPGFMAYFGITGSGPASLARCFPPL